MRFVVVTGGSRGIGAATAVRLAQDGWGVVFSYRSDADAAAAVVKQCHDAGSYAVAVQADMSSEDDIMNLFHCADQEEGHIAGLVNNAAVIDQQSRVETFSSVRLQRMFNINVVAPFLCAREAIRRMSTANGGSGGSIVNVSSVAARLGSPNEYVDYAASKGAIDTMTIGLAKEVAETGIRVNGVRPGTIHTEMHASGGEPDRANRVAPAVPMKRAGEPSEIANAIAWLLSDEASYASGAVLDVAGGR